MTIKTAASAIPIGLLLGCALFAQSITEPAQKQPLRFEVTSVKPNSTGRAGAGDMPLTGRVNIVGWTFMMLMKAAYRVQDYQIIGGPGWLVVDRYDVQASPPADFQPQRSRTCFVDCTPTPVQIMVQTLLADRFQLKVHRETRELPAYDLTIAKNGFKLKAVAAPLSRPDPASGPPPLPPPPRPGTPPPTIASALPTPPPGFLMTFPFGFAASGLEFHSLAGPLEDILGRPVIDKTGIKGLYDFKLVFSRDGLPGNGPAPPAAATDGPGFNAADPRPSIFTAIQEELGLKLESSKEPVEVLVIDSVSKPTEN